MFLEEKKNNYDVNYDEDLCYFEIVAQTISVVYIITFHVIG